MARLDVDNCFMRVSYRRQAVMVVVLPVALLVAACAATDPASVGPSAASAVPTPASTVVASASGSPEPGSSTITTDVYPVPAGSRPHDVAPAEDGGVWYTAGKWRARMAADRLVVVRSTP